MLSVATWQGGGGQTYIFILYTQTCNECTALLDFFFYQLIALAIADGEASTDAN